MADFDTYYQRINQKLIDYLPEEIPLTQALHEGMTYAVSQPGKRIRPLLVYGAGNLFDVPLDILDIPACSVEYVHCFSLVHDDLPAMDDADLRRGQPTCHKCFGEDMAILIGDALMTLAHHILVAPQNGNLTDTQRNQLLNILTTSGAEMVAGQAIDIRHLNTIQTVEDLKHLHRLKTGAMIKASVSMGAACATNITKQHSESLEKFGALIGLAFQIQDDILDITSSTTVLGKPQGKDAELKKTTFPTLLGLDESKNRVKGLCEEARACLSSFGNKASMLHDITDLLLKRNH